MRLVDLTVVENEIVRFLEETKTPERIGDPIWEKIMEALERIRKQAFDGSCT